MFDSELYHRNLLTDYIGRNLLYFKKLHSTNTRAFELAKSAVENGTVIITDNQIAGRGRQSNKWFSASSKSLTFSIIIYPNGSIDEINKYSIISGLAVHDTLMEYKADPTLKWPNDVLINNKKICGILCESKMFGEKVITLVIGIGININENETEFPEDLRSISTSLLIEIGQQNKVEIILATILNKFEQRLNNFNEFDKQISYWERNCFQLNNKVSFKYNNKIIDGIFKGLTYKGQAILSINGAEKIYDSGELL